jgi:hypothetical protein
MIRTNICLGQAGSQGQGSGGEQSGQGFHGVSFLGELFKWVQINRRNLIHP